MPVQYPPNTELVYSYFESRGGQFDETVFFGLQYELIEYLSGVVVTPWAIDVAERYNALHFNNDKIFNRSRWEYIVKNHQGKLPLLIKSVPEGTVVPTRNVLFTVENTDPACYWLTTHVETTLSHVWYPSTVATASREQKKIIRKYADMTSDDSFIDFKLHDFGGRGVSSQESGAIGGSAHLINFQGTDTLWALPFILQYYTTDNPVNPSAVHGFSIPAAEHSTITSWLRSNESQAFENMLEKFPTGLVAVVSDSFDIYNAVDNIWGKELKDKVLSREGTLVIRPDSGEDIPGIIVRLLDSLGESFGFTYNSKGYKVLDPHVRLIQGDGIDIFSIEKILARMASQGWAVDNIAFGSGGALLQKWNRDTSKYAYKASYVIVDGEERDVFKDPITDPGKKSKTGRLSLIRDEEGNLTTVRGEHPDNLLRPVFLNGEVLVYDNFEDIRKRALV